MKFNFRSLASLSVGLLSLTGLSAQHVNAEVTLQQQVKISDEGLHFDGADLDYGNVNTADTGEKYDYFFGRNISAHGDAVKTYKHYVFMTWYRGGKDNRQVMLTRYNTETGTLKHIEFPHRHTGFRGNPLIGESHNTIGLSVSPINGTIHMVYDMHAYDNNNHSGKFKDDFFRYSYSVPGTAEVADDEFVLDRFVKDTSEVSQGSDDYKHLTMTGDLADKGNFARLTYPKFFTNTDGTLLLYMRLGGNNNGGYVFNRYNAQTNKWSTFTPFNVVSAKNHGNKYNWGLYGNMKYVNGKLRVGFQQRSSDNSDRYKYQNGVYYAYSDHPEGFGEWKNHQGETMTWPLVDSDEIKVFEPGDYITHQEANSVYIVGSFDWTVTAKGDIHIISKVRSTDKNRPDYQEVYLHSYKPAGAEDFIVTKEFTGASNIYTSGDNVYIIGLRNGYPYVEKALGGTSNFSRVYEQTNGTQFDHGTVYIKDGKVYYYLMERNSGSAMPLHLQIIDLDLAADANKPVLSFPQSSMTVSEGYEQLSFKVEASSPVEGRTISKVDLYVDDNFIRTDSADPFVWGHKSKPTELLGLTAGVHNFKAVATDSEGQTAAAFMQLKVESLAPTITLPNDTMELIEGYEKLSIEVQASTNIEGRYIKSVTMYVNGDLVRVDDSFKYLFGHSSKPHETGAMGWLDSHQPNPQPLAAGEHIFSFVAEDNTGAKNEASMKLTVVGTDVEPVVSFPKETYTVTEGYEKFGLTINATSPVEGRTIKSVTLYRNDELVRVDTRPIWNFGHSHAPYEFGAMGWLERHEPNPAPLGPGEHIFKAVAIDNEGTQGEGFMTLIVKELPAPSVNFLESNVEITEGYQALSLSANVLPADESISTASVGLYINDLLIREIYEPPFTWGGEFNAAELLGLTEGVHTVKAVATDSNNKMSDTQLQITVVAAPLLGDLDKDGDVDRDDVRLFSLAIRAGSISDTAYDFNKDGTINGRDVRGVALLCTRSRCATE